MARRRTRSRCSQLGIAPCETYPDSVRPICKIVEHRSEERMILDTMLSR